MIFVLRKKYSYLWLDVVEVESLEELLGRFSHCGTLITDLVIRNNRLYNESACFIQYDFRFRISLEDAYKISKAKYEIEINIPD